MAIFLMTTISQSMVYLSTSRNEPSRGVVTSLCVVQREDDQILVCAFGWLLIFYFRILTRLHNSRVNIFYEFIEQCIIVTV